MAKTKLSLGDLLKSKLEAVYSPNEKYIGADSLDFMAASDTADAMPILLASSASIAANAAETKQKIIQEIMGKAEVENVNGIPVVLSPVIPPGKAYLVNKDALNGAGLTATDVLFGKGAAYNVTGEKSPYFDADYIITRLQKMGCQFVGLYPETNLYHHLIKISLLFKMPVQRDDGMTEWKVMGVDLKVEMDANPDHVKPLVHDRLLQNVREALEAEIWDDAEVDAIPGAEAERGSLKLLYYDSTEEVLSAINAMPLYQFPPTDITPYVGVNWVTELQLYGLREEWAMVQFLTSGELLQIRARGHFKRPHPVSAHKPKTRRVVIECRRDTAKPVAEMYNTAVYILNERAVDLIRKITGK